MNILLLLQSANNDKVGARVGKGLISNLSIASEFCTSNAKSSKFM